MTKVCNACHKEKDISEFFKDPRYKNGVKSVCKKCNQEYGKERFRRISLSKKGNCPECGKKLGLYKQKWCSQKCFDKVNAPKKWLKQKSDPKYKEYHREVARKWAMEHYISKKYGVKTI